MQRKKLIQLLGILAKEEKLAEKRANELKEVANETAKATVSSWSAGGDRFHTQSQALAAEEFYQKILALKKKIEEATKKSTPASIVSPCFIKLILSGKEEDLYLVDEAVNVSGARLVSISSLFGRAVIGKKMGEAFNFQTEDGKKVEGKIINFE